MGKPVKEMETVCVSVYDRWGKLIKYKNIQRPKKDDTKK
jgi:hypothetical protein